MRSGKATRWPPLRDASNPRRRGVLFFPFRSAGRPIVEIFYSHRRLMIRAITHLLSILERACSVGDVGCRVQWLRSFARAARCSVRAALCERASSGYVRANPPFPNSSPQGARCCAASVFVGADPLNGAGTPRGNSLNASSRARVTSYASSPRRSRTDATDRDLHRDACTSQGFARVSPVRANSLKI